jgi:redox-sensitive bicupin YhaK (pirin superfamily)
LPTLTKGTSASARSRARYKAASFILVGGKPLNEPIARYGPFVMNTADEIRQAIMDYQAGRF